MMISSKNSFLLKLILPLLVFFSLESFSYKNIVFTNESDSLLIDSGIINKSILDYEQALENSKQIDDLKGIATALRSLGKMYSDKGEYENALEYLLNSISIEKDLHNEKEIAEIYTLLANVYNKSGNSRKALENYKKSLTLYEKLDIKEKIASTFNYIGLIYSNWEDYEKSLVYFQKSLDIKESTGNKTGVANCYNNMAYIYYRWGDYEQALEYNHRSLSIYEELNIEKKKSDVLNNIGLIYIETKKYDKSLEFIIKSLEIEKKLNHKLGIAKSYNNIGLIYHKEGNLRKAFKYYKDALIITEDIGDTEQLAIGYSNIGTIYLHNNDISEALKYLEKSNTIALKGNYKRTLMYNYRSFSSAYSMLNDDKKAFEYYKIFVAEKDSVFNKEKHKQINELKILYETEKKEQEINLLNTENKLDKIKLKTQKKELILLATGFFIILILLILNFIHNSKIKRAYNDLVSKNVEIAKREKELQEAKKQSKNLAKGEITYQKELQDKVNQKVTRILTYLFELSSNDTHAKKKPDYVQLIEDECNLIASELNHIPSISDSIKEKNSVNDKYINSPISEDQKQELLDGIVDLMENKKVFLDKDLSLEKMANYLDTNRKYISQIINEKYDQNVSNFINEYRIKEARQLLSDSEYKKLTIEGIATTVGFNSKSAFNISFKKITGITPSFYQKSVCMNINY